MEKTKTFNSFQYLWAYSVCIYGIIMANVSWGWGISREFAMAYIAIISFLKLSKSNIEFFPKCRLLIISFIIYELFNVIIWNEFRIGIIISAATYLLLIFSIVLSIYEEKKLLLKAMSNCFVVILLISLPAWILYLMGVQLPHGNEIRPNDFHVLFDYHFFLTTAQGYNFFPRFQSIFLEPGQFATPCAFLYFLNGANFSRKNILFLIAILLSFSLISYGLTIAAFTTSRMFRSQKHRIFKTIISVIAIAGISFYFSNSENEDDPITTLIVYRLQYDEEKGISGNNRTTSYFDSQYEQLMSSSDRYWGIHQQLKEGEDWTYNTSGYKKVIVHRGIIGLFISLLIPFLLFYYNRNLATASFLVMVVTAYMVRDLMMSPLWMSIAIIGFYILGKQAIEEKTLTYSENAISLTR